MSVNEEERFDFCGDEDEELVVDLEAVDEDDDLDDVEVVEEIEALEERLECVIVRDLIVEPLSI